MLMKHEDNYLLHARLSAIDLDKSVFKSCCYDTVSWKCCDFTSH